MISPDNRYNQQVFVLPLFVLVHREDPLLRRLASALLVLLVRYPASWELLLSGTLTLRLLIFLFSFSMCRTIFYSRDVSYGGKNNWDLFLIRFLNYLSSHLIKKFLLAHTRTPFCCCYSIRGSGWCQREGVIHTINNDQLPL